MTCVLMTPVRLQRARVTGGESTGSVMPTRVLDHDSEAVVALAMRVTGETPQDRLRSAHALVQRAVRPVYGMNERQPASRTLRLGRGSCSQRMAILEAVARRDGIPTRVRGLILDGAFWYPRFRWFTWAVPERILLAWPQFSIDGQWLDAGDLFEADGTERPFTNAGAETLFDALARGAVRRDAPALTCDCEDPTLADWMLADLGSFASRDVLYDAYGQNLPTPARVLAGPVMGRWAAGALA